MFIIFSEGHLSVAMLYGGRSGWKHKGIKCLIHMPASLIHINVWCIPNLEDQIFNKWSATKKKEGFVGQKREHNEESKNDFVVSCWFSFTAKQYVSIAVFNYLVCLFPCKLNGLSSLMHDQMIVAYFYHDRLKFA